MPLNGVIRFVVDGEPVAKQRARLGNQGRFYTPGKTAAYEEKVRFCAHRAGLKRANGFPLADPFGLVLRIYSGDRKRRDLDNIEKAIKDALNRVAWLDDSQVDWVYKERFRTSSAPRIEIHVGVVDAWDARFLRHTSNTLSATERK